MWHPASIVTLLRPAPPRAPVSDAWMALRHVSTPAHVGCTDCTLREWRGSRPAQARPSQPGQCVKFSEAKAVRLAPSGAAGAAQCGARGGRGRCRRNAWQCLASQCDASQPPGCVRSRPPGRARLCGSRQACRRRRAVMPRVPDAARRRAPTASTARMPCGRPAPKAQLRPRGLTSTLCRVHSPSSHTPAPSQRVQWFKYTDDYKQISKIAWQFPVINHGLLHFKNRSQTYLVLLIVQNF